MKKLNEIEKNNPFRVPDNYFDSLNEKINEITTGATPIPSVKPAILIRLRPVLAIAASVCLLVIIGTGAYKYLSERKQMPSLSEISLQELPEFLFTDIDLSVIENTVESDYALYDLSEISKSEIIDYLLLENIDENEIYSLL